MGKLYLDELNALPRTYTWSRQVNIDRLADAIASTTSLPLLAVGSGGALTAAHFAAVLHQNYTGKASKAVTPLEMNSLAPNSRGFAVILLTAGGANPDVLGLFRRLALCEPKRLIVVCARKSSPLSDLAERFHYVDFIDFELPSGKDGFLATNSLLAFCVLLRRAYAKVFSSPNNLPRSFRGLIYPTRTRKQYIGDLKARCTQLWTRENLVIVFGPSVRCGAIDLESKLTEAALIAVQTADYRNFAHGRHHWLAKHGTVTAVLALVTREDASIAERTLKLLPKTVPASRINISNVGIDAHLEAIVIGFLVAGFVGEARGINLGRPGVPLFGRKIYHLNAFKQVITSANRIPEGTKAAIERKSGSCIDNLRNYGTLRMWKNYYNKFISAIRSTPFQGVVLDYDGTLCDHRKRFTGWQEEVKSEVVRLLKAGVLVGIATGRGKSARDDLRQGIPKNLWRCLVVGYLNGADIAFLSDDMHPAKGKQISLLQSISRVIQRHPMTHLLANRKNYPRQISLFPRSSCPQDVVWECLQNLKIVANNPDLKIVRSSHSIDILGPNVSKVNVVDRIRWLLKDMTADILCIGDQGKWPGNDFSLLSEPFSLSVDDVSSDPATCWNIAPPGCRGVQATIYYLKLLKPTRSADKTKLLLLVSRD